MPVFALGGAMAAPDGKPAPGRYTKPNRAQPPAKTTGATARGGHAKVGGPLRNEIIVPLALGSFAAFASVGIVAAAAAQLGAPIVPIVGAAGVGVLAGGLGLRAMVSPGG